ncbi:MAG: hypothetical protein ACRD0K_05105 [Egibacteraceae bacterium]
MSPVKIVVIIICVFLVFFMFSAPADAAVMVKETARLAWSLLSGAATALQTFVTELIR